MDDEPLSQEVIEDFVKLSPEIDLIGVCNNALEATEMLSRERIDLMFLDINMPKLSGIGFVKSLKNPPLVVLVTAYPEYALEGFEIEAVDYLLKPVAFERFRVAVSRVLDRFEKNAGKPESDHIMLRADKKNYRVEYDDIEYLEARGDYVLFARQEASLLVHGRLKDFLSRLPEDRFIQVHKSYAISIKKVDYLEGNTIKVGEQKIPVSLSFKENLNQYLKRGL